MNKELASKTLRTVATKHMPKNARQFTWLYTGDKKRSNILGGRAFSKPVKGKVIHIDDQFMILKTQRTHFLVTLKSLLDIEPAVGDNVLYTEYTPRRMDGSYLYDFEQIPGSTTIILTVSSLSNWNLPKPDNPFLQQLVDQLVNMEAEDGKRTLLQLLIDAGASDWKFYDELKLENNKFPWPALEVSLTYPEPGRLQILYDQGIDYYQINWISASKSHAPELIEDVSFDDLPRLLGKLFDDGRTLKDKITILSREKVKKLADM